MSATAKSAQLQIRVSPAEKAAIQRAARRAGLDASAYVLARVLPALARRFQDLTEDCADPEGARALAELNAAGEPRGRELGSGGVATAHTDGISPITSPRWWRSHVRSAASHRRRGPARLRL
jgi:hypothetical protein